MASCLKAASTAFIIHHYCDIQRNCNYLNFDILLYKQNETFYKCFQAESAETFYKQYFTILRYNFIEISQPRTFTVNITHSLGGGVAEW